jgi:hypothetical protein
MTDIDEIGSNSGCFHTKRRKRKHSETEENENKKKPEKKSLFSVISEKLSFTWTKEELQTPPPRQPRSILSPNSSYASYNNFVGELNYSFEHDDGGFGESNFVTNNYNDFLDDPPKKRVKFDEENIVVSSITYQRQQQAMRLEHLKSNHQNKSIFSKFIDFTSSLF